MMKNLVLHLGSNCGNRKQNLVQAIELLDFELGEHTRQSSYYETAAWGKEDQDNFINIALSYSIDNKWDAFDLLKTILGIETKMKRERFEKWGPRIIDIDILYLDNEVVKNKVLQIPHPLLQERKFVLVPLNEIEPDFFHPVLKKTSSELLAELKDDLEVWKMD